MTKNCGWSPHSSADDGFVGELQQALPDLGQEAKTGSDKDLLVDLPAGTGLLDRAELKWAQEELLLVPAATGVKGPR